MPASRFMEYTIWRGLRTCHLKNSLKFARQDMIRSAVAHGTRIARHHFVMEVIVRAA